MARIRTIKPEFWQNESLASCSPHARLLAIALLQLSDANGVFRNIPMQVHAHAFPWETEVNTQQLLGELQGVGYLKLYPVQGKQYGIIHNFTKHQRLTGKEAQSGGQYPTPDQADPEENQSVTETGTENNSQGSSGEAPGKHLDAQEREREVGKGSRKGKEYSPTRVEESGPVYKTKRGRKLAGEQLAWFEQFWEMFEYKSGKAEAADAWLDLKITEADLPEILDGAAVEAQRRPELERLGRIPKMAQGWLSGRRWEDAPPPVQPQRQAPRRNARDEQMARLRGDTDDAIPGEVTHEH